MCICVISYVLLDLVSYVHVCVDKAFYMLWMNCKLTTTYKTTFDSFERNCFWKAPTIYLCLMKPLFASVQGVL